MHLSPAVIGGAFNAVLNLVAEPSKGQGHCHARAARRFWYRRQIKLCHNEGWGMPLPRQALSQVCGAQEVDEGRHTFTGHTTPVPRC